MRAAAIILVALCVALPAATQPRIADPRTELRPGSATAAQFGDVLDAIGIIVHADNAASTHAGSAFVVGRCHALTSRSVAAPGSMAFAAGQAGDRQTPRKRVTRAMIVAAGQGPSADWVLLRLADCDRNYPRIELGRLDEFDLAGGLINALGFDSTRDGVRLMAHLNCRPLWRRSDDRFAMTCAVGAGQSGGPVLAQWGPQRSWVAIGIATRESFVDPDTTRIDEANPYTSIDPALSDIEAAIRDDLRRKPAR